MIAELSLASILTVGGHQQLVGDLVRHQRDWRRPGHEERAAFAARADPALEGLRAGAPRPNLRPGQDERAALEAAQRRSIGLDDQRAGDVHLSDRELTIIAITVGVILLLILIF